MNPIQLIFSSLLITTAWGKAKQPFVFFANVSGGLKPLSGHYLGEQFDHSSLFVYGDPSATPVEFDLEPDNGPSTLSTRGIAYAGYQRYDFVFGPLVDSRELELVDGRLFRDPYFSCIIPNGQTHDVRYISRTSKGNGCFRVKIFFLRYNKENGTAIIDGTPPPGLVRGERVYNKGYKEYYDLPFVFFANISGVLKPLSIHLLSQTSENRHVLSYGDPLATPTEVLLAKDYAYYTGTSGLQNIGVDPNGLVFGRTVPKTKLNLDERMRVRNYDYYSCRSTGNLRVINTCKHCNFCFETEIYLFHYNRTSRYAVIPE